ncbi:MAG: uncharacterized protein JWP46_923 [Modestobacter sp.]|nr:uncharacterized protein [Modestobacter sp.]
MDRPPARARRDRHGRGLRGRLVPPTVPRGWEVVRHEMDADDAGPTGDDLLALADAVREAARPEPERGPADDGSGTRRGHLRVLPNLP